MFLAGRSIHEHARTERADRLVIHHRDDYRRPHERPEYRWGEVVSELAHDRDVRIEVSNDRTQSAGSNRIRDLKECLCRWEIRTIYNVVTGPVADFDC